MKMFIQTGTRGICTYHYKMKMTVTLTNSTHHSTLCIPSLLKQSQFLGTSFNVSSSWRSLSSSALEIIGGVTIDKGDVVKDDPANNVPDTIYKKLGLQLHQRDKHPLGILKNAIYSYFDLNYSGKFVKFDNLCPIVSAKE
ncbi:hypothetical protein MKW94_025943, partial [Papaver nudicaule]|nr:hypothetical protein [Papaver nudicaule]